MKHPFLLLLVIVLLLIGCDSERASASSAEPMPPRVSEADKDDAGPFEILPIDGRFSTAKEVSISSEGCRLSKRTVSGSQTAYGAGVFLNPLAIKDPQTGKVLSEGFTLVNHYEYNQTTGMRDAIGYAESLVFNADGEVISVKFIGKSSAFVGEVSSGLRYDLASGAMPPGSFMKIINAKKVAVQITGSRRSVTFEEENILPSFRENLRRFTMEVLVLGGGNP